MASALALDPLSARQRLHGHHRTLSLVLPAERLHASLSTRPHPSRGPHSRACDMNRGFLSTWGHSRTLDRERRTAFRSEVPISYIAIAGTLISILAFTVEGGIGLISLLGRAEWAKSAELLVGKGLIGFFLFSGLIYQLTRLGYLKRFATHRTPCGSALNPHPSPRLAGTDDPGPFLQGGTARRTPNAPLRHAAAISQPQSRAPHRRPARAA